MPGPGAKLADVALEGLGAASGASESAEYHFRMHVGDDRFGLEPSAALQCHAGRAPPLISMRATVAQQKFAALRLQRPDHRLDDRIRAARADHHAEALVGHLEIGKQRAARDVWREIEMQAPGRHHRFDLRMLRARTASARCSLRIML